MLKINRTTNHQPSVNVTSVQQRHRKSTMFKSLSRSYFHFVFFRQFFFKGNGFLMYFSFTVLSKHTKIIGSNGHNLSSNTHLRKKKYFWNGLYS